MRERPNHSSKISPSAFITHSTENVRRSSDGLSEHSCSHKSLKIDQKIKFKHGEVFEKKQVASSHCPKSNGMSYPAYPPSVPKQSNTNSTQDCDHYAHYGYIGEN